MRERERERLKKVKFETVFAISFLSILIAITN